MRESSCVRSVVLVLCLCFFFFFNDTATTEIYTLSLHDALPISQSRDVRPHRDHRCCARTRRQDRKSTRLNSSHGYISYAVFCLKKKNIVNETFPHTQTSSTPHPARQPPRRT